MPGYRSLEIELNDYDRDTYSYTRPDHGPTQIFKERFLQLPVGSKVRMNHRNGYGIVVTLMGFGPKIFIAQWDTEFGPQIHEHYYTDSGLTPYDTNAWNKNNWTEIVEIVETSYVFGLREMKRKELLPIRWQEAGF